MRAIFGADRMREGEVWVKGQKVDIKSPADAKKAGMGFVTEDRKEEGCLLSFPVGTNITMASFDHFVDGGVFNKKKEKEIIDKQIRALNVKTPSADVRIANLSGGNQQKCLIARWMENDPDILILDEPTKGIDVGAKYEIYVLMKEIAESGKTVIMISSELPEVINMSNRIYVIADGRIVGELKGEDLTEEVVMAAALGEGGM